jgi:hypothetical protein
VAEAWPIFNKLEAEIEGEENTHCPLRTHYALQVIEDKETQVGGEGGIRSRSSRSGQQLRPVFNR